VTGSLSKAQVEQYRRDGYLCPLTVLSDGQAARYRAALEAAEAAAGGSLPGPFRHKPHLVYGWAQELIREPAILDAIEGIIGPDILVWGTVFFTKEPRTEDFISWHEDITYWSLDQDLAPEAVADLRHVRDRRVAILMRDAAGPSRAAHTARAM
jgi:non-haem Fe2+, alpha-ketoglutarate-dependent halogenase